MSLLYTSNITKVRFELAGTNDITEDSHVAVTSADLFRNNLPYPGGTYDGHLGTTDHGYRCQTCHNMKKGCLGHDGHTILNYPIQSPIMISEIRKWLKLICFNCGLPIIDESLYKKFDAHKRLDEASKLARNSVKRCIHCGELHPTIVRDKTDILITYAELYDDKKLIERKKLYPHIIERILMKISDSTVISLGKYLQSHPNKFIIRALKIPPNTIRPDIKKIGGGRSTNDDLTTILQYIIKKNESVPLAFEEPISDSLDKLIYDINSAYYNYVKGNTGKQVISSGSQPLNALSIRLKGKPGQIRRGVLGKRIFKCGRSTITGDCNLKIDEIGVPIKFARTLSVEEVVQEYNKHILMIFFNNGRHRYPGCTKIIKASTGMEHGIENLREDFELEIGDIIFRDLIDGDYITFNRQPSIKPSNIGAHRVVVTHDPNILTLRFNVIGCKLYDADFDGDQMNIYVNSSIAGRNEIAEMSGVQNWIILHSNSTPIIGQVDDSIIGAFELTRNGVKFDKYHMMLVFSNSSYLPTFNSVTYTGYDAITKLLEETPINYSRDSTYYNPDFVGLLDYDPADIRVKIEHGVHKQGVLDKKAIGNGSVGCIFHIINNEYGPHTCIEVMHNMQQLTISYIMQFGYSMGLIDLIVNDETQHAIHQIETAILNESQLVTEKLNAGEIIPPIGKTIEEFYEEQQISVLRVLDDFAEPIFKNMNQYSNNLFKLIICGSKGKFSNIYHMISSIGQIVINGNRPKQNFSYKRSLAYFPRFDTSPESRGYVTNSYINGINSAEFFFGAMNARFDLITKALLTSVTGEQGRKSIKCLESIVANNYRMSVKGNNVVQWLYGDDGIDPRYIEKVKFPTIMLSDKAFAEKYNGGNAAEFKQLSDDRALYRKMYMQLELSNVKDLMTDMRAMPVNIPRVIEDVLSEYNAAAGIANKAESADTIAHNIATVKEFCNNLPYVYMNESQEANKGAIAENIQMACTLMKICVRSYLNSATLLNKINEQVLQIILDKIKLKYIKALVDYGTAIGIIGAQSFSGPLTQYMIDAHHRTTSGGTSTSGMSKAKEIFGAKKREDLGDPSMTLLVDKSLSHTQIQELANNIEEMSLREFVVKRQIFFEKYGAPIHPAYVHEAAMITDFQKHNPLLKPPGDLVKWCIRITLNKTTMILKHMSLELIVNKLRHMYEDVFIVYTPENAPEIILRIYIRNTMFKSVDEEKIISFSDTTLLDTVIRGITGIKSATVTKLIGNKEVTDANAADVGAIVRNTERYGIVTQGTNMSEVLKIRGIDPLSIQSNSIDETYQMLGIEAARHRIITEMRGLGITDTNYCHLTIYADEMTYTGKVTGIERSGLGVREVNNIMLRLGFSSPMQTLEEAGINSMEDRIQGVTGPLFMGTTPKYGTNYNSFVMNEEFVRTNTIRADKYLDEL